MSRAPKILLADDDPQDKELIVRVLTDCGLGGNIAQAQDGAEALDYIFSRGRFANRPPGRPAVVLLDLKMPKVNGLQVLKQLRSEPQTAHIPVVIFTSSREERDVIEGYDLGANAYVVKPINYERFVEAVKEMGFFWTVLNEPAPNDGGDEPTK